MNLQTAIALARKYQEPVLVALIIIGMGGWYLFQEYKELAVANIALAERKTELDKREFIVQQQERENKERLATIQKKMAEYDAMYAKLQQTGYDVSAAQRLKEGEKKLQRLMHEFSEMGVDMNAPLRCNDANAQAKYYAAKAKYSEVSATAEAYHLTSRYRNFLSDNSQWIFSACVK